MSRYPLGPFTVSRVGFGAMQLPGPGVWGPPRDRDEALGVLRRAVELGVDHTSSVRHLEENLAVADISLSADTQQELAAIAA